MEQEKREIEYPSGVKWTKQRKDVYSILIQAKEPLSAVQIYHKINIKQEESYAVSTIYRILAVFEKQGLVTKTAWMGDNTVVYELNRGEHTHYAICLECHKRIPLSACPFAKIPIKTKDFEVTGHKLELYGYCKDCNKSHKG